MMTSNFFDEIVSMQKKIITGIIFISIISTFASFFSIECVIATPYTPSNPTPGNGSIDISVVADLSWTGGGPDNDTVTYDVYFGTTNPPPKSRLIHQNSPIILLENSLIKLNIFGGLLHGITIIILSLVHYGNSPQYPSRMIHQILQVFYFHQMIQLEFQ
jgi:hypothetical protein